MYNLNVLLIICTVVANAKSVGVRESSFERKRFDLGLETCTENFDVHVDKIIRTQDSRAMGAKYLTEAEVTSRDDCMKMCCETALCDVFVLEQKVPGSCYLFHCGSPEDFKCKFTQHKNYTSAVLAFNNRFEELDNRMKLAKHEEELNMLRKLEQSVDYTSTSSPTTTKVPAIPPQTDKQNHSLKNQCSRYQFECRGSGECIAIYNACDGIPQCSDGSDEAPELDCPAISGATHPKTFHDQLKSLKEASKDSSLAGKMTEPSTSPRPVKPNKETVAKAQVSQVLRTSPFSGYLPFGFPQQTEEGSDSRRSKVEAQQPVSNQPKYNGREGEIIQYPVNNVQWQGYQPPRQEENGYIFNRKGSGLVSENTDSQLPNPYGNDLGRGEYLKYGNGPSNNAYYSGSGPVYYPGPNGWIQRVPQPLPHGAEENPQRPVMSMYGNGVLGSAPSDYYYEDSQFRGRYGQVPQDLRRVYNPDGVHMSQKNVIPGTVEKSEPAEPAKSRKDQENVKYVEPVKEINNGKPTSIPATERVDATTRGSAVTLTKKERPREESALRVAEYLKMNEADMKNADGVNERPSGAILSLTLGMCITAIMITLVGCRLRVVRRRMRRNGKSPYAHDADFLVNGMYL